MKTDKQNISKAKGSVSVRRNNKAESIIDRVVAHLTLVTLLVIVGLLFKDQMGFRGFPFAWFHVPDLARYDRLITSFVVLLAVSVCADLIASAIGRIKEPAMKVFESRTPSISAETAVMPAERTEAERAGKQSGPRELKTLIQHANNTKTYRTNKGKKKLSALVWIVVAIAILSFIGGSVDDKDYDTNYDDNTYEDSYDYTLTEISDDIIYLIKWGYYDDLSQLGDPTPVEEVGDLSGCEVECYKDQYFTTDDKKHAIFKYMLYEDRENEDAAVYLVGLLIGGDVSETYPKDTKLEGFTIYKFSSYDEYKEFYESEDGEILIDKAKCVSLGEVEAENMFILNMH